MSLLLVVCMRRSSADRMQAVPGDGLVPIAGYGHDFLGLCVVFFAIRFCPVVTVVLVAVVVVSLDC